MVTSLTYSELLHPPPVEDGTVFTTAWVGALAVWVGPAFAVGMDIDNCVAVIVELGGNWAVAVGALPAWAVRVIAT
jgi:hypothetical protein